MSVNNQNQCKIVLRDLQSLLCQTMGDQVEVVDYTTTPLLGKGENYSSTMLKVEALIKINPDSAVEKLFLAAKMIPTDEFQTTHLKNTASFAKEIFVSEKLVPTYRELEKEIGVKDSDLIDVLPRFYGGRLTRNKEIPDQADDDAVLLMENLKERNYYTANRLIGLDFDHAKFAIIELARYHALGVALRYKNPKFFEEAKKVCDAPSFELGDDFIEVNENIYKIICEDPRIAKYQNRIKACLDKYNFGEKNVKQSETWIGITHGDFWVNNMLFHKTNGKIDSIKFVDFQLISAESPLQDIPYFLCGSANYEVMEKHFDDLLNIYYDKFIEVLSKTGCDTTLFTKKSFEEQLKIDGSAKLLFCLLAVKFITLEVSKDTDLSDIKSSVMMTGGNKRFHDRVWQIISKYIEKEWI